MPDLKLYNYDEDKRLFFSTSDPDYVDGITMLAQWSLKLLLDSADGAVSQNVGGNLESRVGNAETIPELKVSLSGVFKDIENFMKSEQEGKADDPNKRLDELQLVSVERGDRRDHIIIKYQVENEAGHRVRSALPIKGG